MEDVYTIKVKTKPDKRNVYPSERRYSASTVSGIAWVHIALAATSFLLACLALVNPNSDIKRLTLNDTERKTVSRSELVFDLANFDATTETATEGLNDESNATDKIEAQEQININDTVSSSDINEYKKKDGTYVLVLAPTLLTIFALAAGIAAVMASVRWYIDRNITWFFFMSVLSTTFSLVSLIMITVFLATTDSEPTDVFNMKDYFIVKSSDVVQKNISHIIVKTNTSKEEETDSRIFTKLVLSINILIACFLELLWSILSVKIAYKGMRNNYKDDNERRGNCISVVTTIKGNTEKLPRNGKLIPPKADFIDYPSNKIKKIFLAQGNNGFYLKNQNNKQKNTETSSEYYKERMMSFLNRCADGNNSEIRTPSEPESVLNAIPETDVEVVIENDPVKERDNSRMTPVSWGDTPDHTIYNQNTLNFDRIFNFKKVSSSASVAAKEGTSSGEHREEHADEPDVSVSDVDRQNS